MSPAEARSHRLLELSRLVGKLASQNYTSEQIITAVRKRANQMASPKTVEQYI